MIKNIFAVLIFALISGVLFCCNQTIPEAKKPTTFKVGEHQLMIGYANDVAKTSSTNSSLNANGSFTINNESYKLHFEDEVLTINGKRYNIPYKSDSIYVNVKNSLVKINGETATPIN